MISALHLFGLIYFSILATQTILAYPNHTSSYPNDTASLLLYCFGVTVWCASSLVSRIRFGLQDNHPVFRKRVEYGGVLCLIWGCTLSVIILLFDTEPLLRSSYLIASTLVFTSIITDLSSSSLDTSAIEIRFPYLCARFGLLSLVPALHALVTSGEKVGLAAEFLYMSVRNTLGAGMYMICICDTLEWRVLPRIDQVIMHSTLLQSIITYAELIVSSGNGQMKFLWPIEKSEWRDGEAMKNRAAREVEWEDKLHICLRKVLRYLSQTMYLYLQIFVTTFW